jgi:hypothetical protein
MSGVQGMKLRRESWHALTQASFLLSGIPGGVFPLLIAWLFLKGPIPVWQLLVCSVIFLAVCVFFYLHSLTGFASPLRRFLSATWAGMGLGTLTIALWLVARILFPGVKW